MPQDASVRPEALAHTFLASYALPGRAWASRGELLQPVPRRYVSRAVVLEDG